MKCLSCGHLIELLEGTVARFCGECGAEISARKPSEDPESVSDFKKQIKYRISLGPSASSVHLLEICAFEKCNFGSGAELEISGSMLRNDHIGEMIEPLAKSDELPNSFPLQFGNSGRHPIRIQVTDCGRRWSGKVFFNITERPSENAVTIQGHNIVGDIPISFGQELSPKLGTWQTSPLIEEINKVSLNNKTVVSGLPIYETNRISLQTRIGGKLSNFCLIAGTEFSLGKGRSPAISPDNDIRLRANPSDGDYDATKDNISRRHAKIRFIEKGVEWENLECGNGTYVQFGTNKEKFAAKESFAIRNNMEIRPADVFGLNALLSTSLPITDQEADEANRLFHRSLEPTLPTRIGPIESVSILRSDGLVKCEAYAIFQRAFVLGADSLPINVGQPPIARKHARVLWNGSSFWLEALQTSVRTELDGLALRRNQLVPLSPHLSITLGDIELTVEEFQQINCEY